MLKIKASKVKCKRLNPFRIGAANSPLLTNLMAYWKLDEASGNRTSSVGGYTLTDTNTVGAASGKINNAADFDAASSECLIAATTSDLSTGNIDFTISVWVNLGLVDSNTRNIVLKSGDLGSEYKLFLAADNIFCFNASTGSPAYAGGFGAPSPGTWYHLLAWFDSAAGTVYLRINDSFEASTSGCNCSTTSSEKFMIGAQRFYSPQNFFDGEIDEVGIWNRLLTTQEKTDLYNAGAGITYPFA
jgi:hypothetical protein